MTSTGTRTPYLIIVVLNADTAFTQSNRALYIFYFIYIHAIYVCTYLTYWISGQGAGVHQLYTGRLNQHGYRDILDNTLQASRELFGVDELWTFKSTCSLAENTRKNGTEPSGIDAKMGACLLQGKRWPYQVLKAVKIEFYASIILFRSFYIVFLYVFFQNKCLFFNKKCIFEKLLPKICNKT